MRTFPLLRFIGGSLVLFLLAGAGAWAQTPQEELGRMLYLDTNLSEPAGQGCVSCHDPAFGFVDPVNVVTGLPVSQGVIPGRFGQRNSPSAAYAVFSPLFTLKGGIQGGQFWDGRAVDLADQARGPFLDPVEMNNTTRGQVIGKIQLSPFATFDIGIPVDATLWVFAEFNGVWYGATWDHLRPGAFCKAENARSLGSEQIMRPPMDGSWVPRSGDRVGFMVSGGYVRRECQPETVWRTNIMLITWP